MKWFSSSKKADSNLWWIIVVAIIAIVVVILILMWFSKSGERAFGGIEEKISGLSDCDKDNTADMFDKCPCVAGDPQAKLDGCPISTEKDAPETKLKVGEKECACK
ncbi:hypothetical protein HZC32_02825 [Candidatus Woesearchaeota archaeon]|nr:hypothetical protein [Candidatus Woesearchaeota archaeon]